jgi:hypothetical protein
LPGSREHARRTREAGNAETDKCNKPGMDSAASAIIHGFRAGKTGKLGLKIA